MRYSLPKYSRNVAISYCMALLVFAGISTTFAAPSAASLSTATTTSAVPLSTATTLQTLHDVDTLIGLHKYRTAYETLEHADPLNVNPDIAVKKAFIALRFFVNSTKHQVFGFKDIRITQTMDDIRGRPDITPIFTFPLDSIIHSFASKDSTRCDFNRILGEYYNDVKYIYAKDWPISQDSLNKLSRFYCTKAYKNGCADWKTYSILADFALQDSNKTQALDFLTKSTQLNDSVASTMYNLAYLYLMKGDNDLTVKYARRVMDLYKGNLMRDANQKGFASRMMAEAYKRMGKTELSLNYCDSMVIIDSMNAENRAAAMNYYFGFDKYDAALKNAIKIFNLAPDAPGNIEAVIGAYLYFKKQDSLPALFSMFLKDRVDSQVLGNIYFHEGAYFLEIKNKEKANELLKLSRSYFVGKPVKNKEVLEIIDQELKKTDSTKK